MTLTVGTLALLIVAIAFAIVFARLIIFLVGGTFAFIIGAIVYGIAAFLDMIINRFRRRKLYPRRF